MKTTACTYEEITGVVYMRAGEYQYWDDEHMYNILTEYKKEAKRRGLAEDYAFADKYQDMLLDHI